MGGVVFAGAAVLLLVLVVVAQVRSRRSRRTSGVAAALGNFIDVFDPAQSRSDRELQSRVNQGEPAPSPDDEPEIPVLVDLHEGTARVRRPGQIRPRRTAR